MHVFGGSTRNYSENAGRITIPANRNAEPSAPIRRHSAGAMHLNSHSGWAGAPGCVSHRRCTRWRVRCWGVDRAVCPQAAAMRLNHSTERLGGSPRLRFAPKVHALVSALLGR